jgi:inosine-uridine nucleoside N-ribohydrolase
MGPTARTCLAIALAARIGSAAPLFAADRVPVVLDTDIGDDIDDTFALLMLARSPELDLRLVVTDFGDTHYRARLTAKLLEAMGRADVPIGVGVRQGEGGGAQAAWLGDYALEKYPGRVHADGVQALIDAVMGSKETVTIVAIGPAPNLEVALAREPRIAGRARFVGMYGSLHRGVGRDTAPVAEWNVRSNVSAFRRVVAAPWPMTMTPLDTCGLVRLTGAKWARVLASPDPGVRALVENNRVWCTARPEICGSDPSRADRDTTTLFDTVAVYLAFSDALLRMEETGISIDDAGRTIPDPTARPLRWAVEWKDLGRYEDLLVERLIGASASAKR